VKGGIYDGSDSGEGQKKTYGCYEEPPSRTIGNAFVNHVA
jgi:hypothetical protein